jgi:A/G-specific adenine glycosylase
MPAKMIPEQSEGGRECRTEDLSTTLFSEKLLGWYDEHKRDLPWRADRDPYRVWLSEIMLQQTRVAAVIEHYRRFLAKFPTIQKLAAAREAAVLAAWSGLGYYRRARMLHAAAKYVVKECGGTFPRNSAELRALPGIGRYTAAAISSIAFHEPVAVVDGNVERVVSRLQGRRLSGQELWQIAERWIGRERPGDFNQAMMELGATVCVPRSPQCLLCPVRDLCATRGELKDAAAVPAQRKREIHFGLARRADKVFLVQRSKEQSLMPGMWELPEYSNGTKHNKPLFSVRHSITVTDYQVRVMTLEDPGAVAGRWVAASRLPSLPLTGLARKILKCVELM